MIRVNLPDYDEVDKIPHHKSKVVCTGLSAQAISFKYKI
jgi:hypothetical protein